MGAKPISSSASAAAPKNILRGFQALPSWSFRGAALRVKETVGKQLKEARAKTRTRNSLLGLRKCVLKEISNRRNSTAESSFISLEGSTISFPNNYPEDVFEQMNKFVWPQNEDRKSFIPNGETSVQTVVSGLTVDYSRGPCLSKAPKERKRLVRLLTESGC